MNGQRNRSEQILKWKILGKRVDLFILNRTVTFLFFSAYFYPTELCDWLQNSILIPRITDVWKNICTYDINISYQNL